MAKNQTILLNLGEGLSLMIGMPAISTWKSEERPNKAKRGTLGFNTQTNTLEYFNGSDWFEASMKKS